MIATMLALAVLILVLGPVWRAFQPGRNHPDCWLHRHDRDSIGLPEAAGYVGAQVIGEFGGAIMVWPARRHLVGHHPHR